MRLAAININKDAVKNYFLGQTTLVSCVLGIPRGIALLDNGISIQRCHSFKCYQGNVNSLTREACSLKQFRVDH